VFTWTAKEDTEDKHFVDFLPSYFGIVGEPNLKLTDSTSLFSVSTLPAEGGGTTINFHVQELKKGQSITAEITVELIERPENGERGYRNCLVAQGNGENPQFDQKI
jgi:hypothetical protein